jgi:hypothetical protein
MCIAIGLKLERQGIPFTKQGSNSLPVVVSHGQAAVSPSQQLACDKLIASTGAETTIPLTAAPNIEMPK